MEVKQPVGSTVQFQGPPAQALSFNKELAKDLILYSFPGMATSPQVPGLCHLLAENLSSRSHLLHMHCCRSIGFSFLAGFASDTSENKLSNWNIVDMIGEVPPLEGEKNCSSEHGTFFSPRSSVVTPHLGLNHYCEYKSVGESFEAPYAIPSGQKIPLFDSSDVNEKLGCDPHALHEFVTPTAEKCTFQVPGMYMGDAVVACSSATLSDMRTRGAWPLTVHNMDDQLQESTCYVEANGRSHGSHGNKSLRAVSGVSSSFHEDTEDLEALMSSDEDEMSTGHSPSDVTWNNILRSQSGGSCKRKGSDHYCFEEDFDSCQEVESKFKENYNLSEIDPLFTPCEIYQYQSSPSPRKFDSDPDLLKSSDLGDVHLCSALQGDMKENLCQDYMSHTGKSGLTTPSKRLKMDKIERTLELLQSVIPGGSSMDLADVLGEAIQYVRMLQHKVSKLEAIKRGGSDGGTR